MDANQKANLTIVKMILAFAAASIGVVILLIGLVYVLANTGAYHFFEGGAKSHEDTAAFGKKYQAGARVAEFVTDALELDTKIKARGNGAIEEITVVPDMQDVATKDEIAHYSGPLHLSVSDHDKFKEKAHALELEFPKVKTGKASITYSGITPDLRYSCDVSFKDGIVTKFLDKSPTP
jgi:hypothetical protein